MASHSPNRLAWKRYRIPIAMPVVTQDDIDAVTGALRTASLSSGDYVEEFEREFARYVGVKEAVAVNSGTAALQLALKAQGIKTGDEVITTSFTIAATSNAIVTLGAIPIFADVEDETYNLDPDLIESKITDRTKAIMPIHYGGQCAEMDRIRKIAEAHDLKVIEDAAPAAGSKFHNRFAGTLADAAGFSFFPDKNMTTGEGGMLATNDATIADKSRYLRKHGAPKRYFNVDIGWNFKMPDFCAALGNSQLKRLEKVIARKNELASYYTDHLKGVDGIACPYVRPYNRHTFMLYAIRLRDSQSREKVRMALENNGIETRINFPPVHLQPIYQNLFGSKLGMLPKTERIAETIISLPIYTQMARDDQDNVIRCVKEALQ